MKHTMLHCANKWVDMEAESCSGKPYKGSCSSCHGIPAGAVLIAAHMLSLCKHKPTTQLRKLSQDCFTESQQD